MYIVNIYILLRDTMLKKGLLLFLCLLIAPLGYANELNSGDTAWILTSTALVLFMTLPGLALFYGGLVRSKNVLSVLMQCFAIACLISVCWVIYGYSLAFKGDGLIIGNLSALFLNGVERDSLSGTLPETVFITFQMTFAIITPALVVGAFAERMKFGAMCLFSVLWFTFVYLPACHMVWGGGYLANIGVIDFAGGLVVHASSGHLAPLSESLLSEPAIVAGMAKASLSNTTLNWAELIKDYDGIRDKIEATIPGFENYNNRVREKGGFYLPNTARNKDFSPTLTGKANFTINAVSDIVLQKNQLIMMTIRTHDQYNTTIYGLDDRYRGIINERRVIFMNPTDMKEQGLEKLDTVDLISHFNQEQRTAKSFLVIPYSIPKQCSATYFPEANVLVPLQSKARISNTPTSKTIIITVHKK